MSSLTLYWRHTKGENKHIVFIKVRFSKNLICILNHEVRSEPIINTLAWSNSILLNPWHKQDVILHVDQDTKSKTFTTPSCRIINPCIKTWKHGSGSVQNKSLRIEKTLHINLPTGIRTEAEKKYTGKWASTYYLKTLKKTSTTSSCKGNHRGVN